jgi:hypothetical protein
VARGRAPTRSSGCAGSPRRSSTSASTTRRSSTAHRP